VTAALQGAVLDGHGASTDGGCAKLKAARLLTWSVAINGAFPKLF